MSREILNMFILLKAKDFHAPRFGPEWAGEKHGSVRKSLLVALARSAETAIWWFYNFFTQLSFRMFLPGASNIPSVTCNELKGSLF